MSFKGDVAQIPLSNILQALLLNGQEGVLTLDAGAVKRRLRVLKQGLRLLNHDAESADVLRQIVVKERLLTESQYQNTMSGWVPGSTYPGDFLISRRILTEDIVTDRVLHQIENIVLELVVTPELRYEFNAAADPTPFEIFNPEGTGQDLVLAANAVLMEALRRDDELRRIRQVIPSPSEIFVVPDRRGLSAKGLEVNAAFLKEVKPYLGGEHSVSRITALTTLSSFEVHQTLYQLLQKGLIRALTLEEKRSLAEKLRKALRPEDAVDTLRSVLLSEPQDHTSRLKLVGLLEKSKDAEPELVTHYVHLSDEIRASDPGRAQTYLQRVVELSPGHLGALERSFDLARAAGDHRSALAAARSIAVSARSSETATEAIALLYKIINFYPQEPVLFHELADVHLHARDVDSAISCLKTVAELHERRGDQIRLKRTVELIARLKPSEAPKLAKLAKRKRSSGGNFRRIARRAPAGAVAALVIGALVFLGHGEYQSRVAYAQALREAEVHKSAGNLLNARQTLEDFEQHFPYSTCIKPLHVQLAELNKLFRVRQEEEEKDRERRKSEGDANYTKAKLALEGNDYIKALDALKQVPLELMGAERALDAATLVKRIEGYFEKANELVTLAETAEQNQDYKRSHSIRCEILEKYPYSKAAVGLLLPLRVESVPPGAEVLLEGQSVGKTPILLRLPSRKAPLITLTRPGYQKLTVKQGGEDQQLNVLESHVVRIALPKAVEWQAEASGSIEGFPAILGETVCLGTRNGKVYCLRQETGEVLWTYAVPESMDFAGGLCASRNLVYFGSFDGRIYVLDGSTGKPVHQPWLATPENLPIKQAPSLPNESGVVVVNCDRKVIAAYNIVQGTGAWTLLPPSGAFLGQPQAYQGNVYLSTTTGEVLEVEQESGRVRQKLSLGAELAARGRAAGGLYIAGTQQGKVIALDLTNQKLAWAYESGESITSPPTVDGEWIIAATSSGKLHCLNSAGELKWVHATRDGFGAETDGAIFRNNLLLGTTRGQVLCVDLWSGNLLWAYRTNGYQEKDQRGILSSGAVARGRLFIGSEDHHVYCFSLE